MKNSKLTYCQDCSGQVSKKVKACIHCGAKIKKQPTQVTAKQSFIAIGFLIFMFMGIFSSTNDNATSSNDNTLPTQIEEQFSPWDGSHRGLEKLIIESLNDPDSYEHIESSFAKDGDTIRVKTSYRARNGYGGMVTAYVLARYTNSGEIVEILEQG